MAKNNTAVAKSSPEEQATIAEIKSLLAELEMQGTQGNEGLDLNKGQFNPPQNGEQTQDDIYKDDAFGGEETTEEEDAEAKKMTIMKAQLARKKLALQKAQRMIAKALQETAHDGVDANDEGDDRAFDLPEEDMEDVNDLSRQTGLPTGAVAKMLQAIESRNKAKVAKSAEAQVIKSLQAQIVAQGELLGEVIGGIKAALGDTGSMPNVPARVQKSARPEANYPRSQDDLINQIAEAVAKKAAVSTVQKSQTGDAELDAILDGTDTGTQVRKSMGAFTELFGQSARNLWG